MSKVSFARREETSALGAEKMSEPETIEESVRAVLDRLGTAYEVIPCDPALADTAAFCAHYGVSPSESANTILVASRKEPKVYAACLALATTKLDVNHKVSEILGVRKLSFASPEETIAVTGMMIGGVTPFGLPHEVLFYVDSRIAMLDRVVVGGGSRSSKLRVPGEVFARMPNARIVEGLAIDRQP
jgi:prolyl-tRNA editing enzyme YbaK/EbsC (Cys-tRNA(Pro) deacylase)